MRACQTKNAPADQLPVKNERHPHLLRADDTQLLVIDMQEPFLREIRNREPVLRSCALLIEASRILEIPTIATVQYREKMGGVVDGIATWLPEPLDKLCFSCAGDTLFTRELAESGRRQILICGVETHICVSQTALDLLSQGFQVHVAADSVSSRADSTHQIGLDKMREAGVVITSAEGAIYELLAAAGTPKFKEILRLIKEFA